MYQLSNNNTIIRLSDRACIPSDPANSDYQDYLVWEAAGNTPTPYEPDPEDAKATLKVSAQVALDKSDVTILRCYERGVSVPTEWADYRAALRLIVSGTSEATELPVRPEYPV